MSNDAPPPRNPNPCGQCDHFDPVLRGTKPTRWGWCTPKSLYPYSDSPGQVTPASAQRVPHPDMPAEPKIVQVLGNEPHCGLYKIKTKKPTKQELLAAAVSGKKRK